MTTKLIAVAVFSIFLFASLPGMTQQQTPTLLLPDNRVLPADKLDSLIKAWGGGDRVFFTHNHGDDSLHVMHLVKATDAQLKQMEDAAAKTLKDMTDMAGHPSPIWKAVDISGDTCSMEALKGKVVVLNFWFTSCPPCIQEIPRLNELVAAYKGKNVAFIGLSFDDDRHVLEFLGKQPFGYRQIPNSGSIDSLYHVQLWPASFVIDRKGVVIAAEKYDPNIKTMLSATIDQALSR